MYTKHKTKDDGVYILLEHRLCVACARMFCLNEESYVLFTFNGYYYYRHFVCLPMTARPSHDARRIT